ncbi:MYND-type domain-containing protein [Mycena indigotica]|uniref:MYND-type domain-containing protein n=1 Tax=Mycena indigotica TaxID=2126181 RepID=A0A8H6S1P9_9AGAR|nr:MYND-type domain-containing protein [Mycena indigotica]KAF7291304.1 MYND-type domain-containing protein [Mycena indigotica]
MTSPASRLRVQISDLDAKIALLEAEIATLQHRKAQVQSQLAQLAYSIQRTIPPEIILEVFAHVLATVAPFPALKYEGFSPFYASLTLASICSDWRRLALASPWMWNCITVELTEGESNDAPPAALLELFLCRSGAAPLDIYVSTGKKTSETTIAAVIELFYRCSQRWRTFQLCVHPLGSLMLSALPKNLAQLQSLSLHGTICYPEDSAPVLDRISSPLLQSLYMSVFDPRLAAASLDQLSVVSLSRASLNGVYIHDVLQLLLFAPQLEVLTVASVLDQDRPHPDMLRADCLHTLVCNGPKLDIIRFATLPALRSLTLRELTVDHVQRESLDRFLQRSGCRVTHMQLQDVYDSNSVLWPCLQSFVHVEDLVLQFAGLGWPRGTLSGLGEYARDNAQLLPALRRLTLRGPSKEANLDGLVRLMENRATSATMSDVRKLAVHFQAPLDFSAEIAALKALDIEEVEVKDVPFEELLSLEYPMS